MKALTTSSVTQQDAFAAYIQQNEEPLFDLCCYLLDDVAAADAVTQQVLINTFPRCSEVTHQELLEIACRCCLSCLSPLEGRLSPNCQNTPVHAAHTDVCCLRQLLEQLPPKSRAILLLHDRYGFPNEEIATLFNLDVQAVRQRLYQARHQAAALLLQDSNLNNKTVHFVGKEIAEPCNSRHANQVFMAIDHDMLG